jgi:two-component system OmpR family response regulator
MRILLVSRQHRESEWLSKALRESAHSLRHSFDLRDGILTVPKESFDAIVLMALDPSSYSELPTALRQFAAAANGTVIIVVLGLATASDRIATLRAGADACFTQPYSYIELHERLQILHRTAMVRRKRDQLPPPLRLDPIKRELIDGNRHLPVTKREYLVLECLMRQFDIPVRHDELLRYAWPEKEDIDFSTASPLVMATSSRGHGSIKPRVLNIRCRRPAVHTLACGEYPVTTMLLNKI